MVSSLIQISTRRQQSINQKVKIKVTAGRETGLFTATLRLQISRKYYFFIIYLVAKPQNIITLSELKEKISSTLKSYLRQKFRLNKNCRVSILSNTMDKCVLPRIGGF